jgi:hypothetical protein
MNTTAQKRSEALDYLAAKRLQAIIDGDNSLAMACTRQINFIKRVAQRADVHQVWYQCKVDYEALNPKPIIDNSDPDLPVVIDPAQMSML